MAHKCFITFKTEDISYKEYIRDEMDVDMIDKSLNDPIKDGDGGEWQDWLVDDRIDQELKLSHKQEFTERKRLMDSSMNVLNQREKEILTARRLSENVATLEDLSKKHKVSRERIRQIETKAFEKLQKAILNSAKSNNLLPRN